jgi:ketol-acid reductoisomerase
MMKTFSDLDSDARALVHKTIAVIGYGSQGRAHALNLKDSGLDVVVGLREHSASRSMAETDGMRVLAIEAAAAHADIVMLLIPDEEQASVYLRSVVEHLCPGSYLGFAHGFAIHFGAIVPPPDMNVFMVAPKAPGPMVRSEFEAGRGVPALISVHQDPAGDTQSVALAYACAIGAGRARILQTTFKEETETDLFGEQAVLCGGICALVQAGFETLVEAGYAPEMAYFECLHELKLIVDLMYARGIEGMREGISNTARFGDYTRGTRVIDENTRETMRAILREVQSGAFAREWLQEHAKGKPSFHSFIQSARDHEIEIVGARLRSFMPWLHAEKKTANTTPSRFDDDELKFRVC